MKVLVFLVILFVISAIGVLLSEKFEDFSLLIPLYSLFITVLIYGVGFSVGANIETLRKLSWLPQESDTTVNLKHLQDCISLKKINIKYIYENAVTIITLATVNLIYLPLNTATFSLATGIKANFNDEVFTQAIGNFFTMFIGAPTCFICGNSIFFRKSGGVSKFYGLLLPIPALLLYKYGLTIKHYTPTIILAFFPMFFGLSTCYSAFYCSYKNTKKFGNIDFIVISLTALICTFFGFIEGVITGFLVNFILLIKEYNKQNKYKKDKFLIENALAVDYLLFFGSLSIFLKNLSKYEKNSNTVIIDFTKCTYIDWLARDTIIQRIKDNLNINYTIIGQNIHFEKSGLKTLVLFQNYTDWLHREI
ncbi:hypothetical protein EDEG_03985 [Edhazardia aedis USNM 41457]|uniref:SLC26A/SulP transporter domain-containing protein n=1 Tax=Edhazardia aedis (strain USNM 41457) TaxID=1003232 RepID=J9D0G8_EDHAE|nr:hypothetical protein EDEG_03985 [Edhazardia aedis USNM 41457]|eukprot:EJW01391.1 hypothetical protein EDEG_03985 [Edhazardia aedis USNM 41457]